MEKPIRILQVCTVLNRGGLETNLMNYYRHIDRSKIQFDFIMHRFDENAYEKEIRDLGGKVYRLPPIHPINMIKYNKQATDFFQKHKEYQIIHNHTSELSYPLFAVSQKMNIPVHIIHAHNSSIDKDFKSFFRLLFRFFVRRKAKHLFTCGEDAAFWLFGKNNRLPVYLMPNAIDTHKFCWDATVANKVRDEMKIVGKMNFVHVGRFNKQKNHIFLLKVFEKIITHNPEASLYLVGDGELRPEIEKMISDLKLQQNVHLLGVKENINEILQAMNFFIFPSLFEGLPVSLVEAQASGLKCFISDGVPSEGILVENLVEVISLKRSPKEWAEIILQNLEYERKDVSDIIRAKGYDIRANAKKLEEKYLELAQRR